MLALGIVLLGICINGIGTGYYLILTLKGKIKPNKITFFVWALAPFVTFLAQIVKGVGIQSIMTLSISIFPLSIFVASFVNKKAYWKITKIDFICGLLSIAGLFLWFLTKEANIAILFSLFSEATATFPTIVKAYIYPKTERPLPWLASVVSGLLTLVTISSFSFANSAFLILYTIEMFLIFLFSLKK
ncbi:MAG TPA: hypothetical protein VF820_04470 [Patescibacteria group bacterium]